MLGTGKTATIIYNVHCTVKLVCLSLLHLINYLDDLDYKMLISKLVKLKAHKQLQVVYYHQVVENNAISMFTNILPNYCYNLLVLNK